MIQYTNDKLDIALEEILDYSADLKNGLTSHATMVVEALYSLGRPEKIPVWLDSYRSEFKTKAPAIKEIKEENWETALGNTNRNTDWVNFFQKELEEKDWKTILDLWVGRLSPGFCSDATHGIIRVGHAVRNLSRSVSELRLRELAEGLGRWACTYQTLPTKEYSDIMKLRPGSAISKIRVVPKGSRKYGGTIVGALKDLDEDPFFSEVIGIVDLSGSVEVTISELTHVFAKVFLENAHDTLGAIVFTHGVTSIVSIRHLLPYVSDKTKRKLLEFGWQSSSSLYASFGDPKKFEIIELNSKTKQELIDKAVENGDEHAIKLTEACLLENDISPDSIYYLAAEKAIKLLEKSK
ncbi:questin oxidase family protein [Leptospira sarikeiensis]|uniref:Questin oxidase family protein n=1 Tax=Leptospira sarikeiensis TaxID=2484943 RepID=A0A4R9KCY8_9LEPT|nr:questin oxidase family protein [Leptospira sarikeiensis]TGL65713.1 questin oxidase family protein [Leptospira sarikeiensis]